MGKLISIRVDVAKNLGIKYTTANFSGFTLVDEKHLSEAILKRKESLEPRMPRAK